MSELRSFPVFGEHGQIGNVLASARFLDDRAEKVIRLQDGREVPVAADALEVQGDGSFRLRNPEVLLKSPMNTDKDAASRKAPQAEAPSDIRLSREAVFQLPPDALFQNGYSVETVSIDKIIDAPMAERHEGETLILPVVEEVWVVEKKLYLREEIRITPRKKPVDKIRTIEKR